MRQPLTGIRVLAVEHFRMGPVGSMMLADAGAEVIKIEPPGTGEAGRNIVVVNREGERLPLLSSSLCRNKKGLSLNLQHERGKELFRELVKRADIVWENMRPGVLDRLGIGYEALKEIAPSLIYVSVSGFGHRDIYESPYWDWPAFDHIGQALSGFMYTTGSEDSPPLYSSGIVGDTIGGIIAAYGALLALQMRERTGQGQHVDVAMYDAMLTLNNYRISIYSLTGSKPLRGTLPTSAPSGPYKTKSGHVVIIVVGDHLWPRFCRLIGREDLLDRPELSLGFKRAEHNETILRPIIEEWASDKTAREAAAFLMAGGIPAAPIQDVEDLFHCPHVKSRQMLVEVEDPEVGRVKHVGNPVKLSGVTEPPPSPPPRVGEHNEEILGGLLGLTSAQIEELRRTGVI